MKNPWKTIETKKIYDNPWIKVIENKVINPSGNNGIYGVVEFKNIAVGVIPIDQYLNTWIVGQYRYTLDQFSWEMPEGGCLKENEVILEACKRELEEETGLSAQKFTPIMELHLSNSVTNEMAYSFLATELTLGTPKPEETEQLTLKKLPFFELYEMCLSNEITDAFTVASVLKLKAMMDRGEVIF